MEGTSLELTRRSFNAGSFGTTTSFYRIDSSMSSNNSLLCLVVWVKSQREYIQRYEYRSLELVHLVLAVSEFLEDARQLALVLGADLGSTNGLVHARRTADEDLDVLLLGFRENGLEQLLGDVALAASPLLGRVVQDIERTEPLRVRVFEFLKLLLQEDVLLRDVPEDQRHLGFVLGVLEDGAHKLVQRSDARATGDQGDVFVLIGLPGILWNWALEVQALPYVHAVQMLGHWAIRIALHDEIQVAGFICAPASVTEPKVSYVRHIVCPYLHQIWECMGE